MAAIFKPLRGSRFRAACGASCAAQCVLRFCFPTHSNLYALGPGANPDTYALRIRAARGGACA